MADALLGGIIINEVLVDPNGANNFDTDGNGSAQAVDEYIELYNSSSVAIDIGGLEMWDAGVGNWFTFPAGTILQPGAHALVMSGVQAGGALPTGGPDDLFFEAGRGSALINNTGDNIVVYDPGADEYIQATFNGDAQDNPPADYAGFSPTATPVGAGEDFGNDIDGFSIQRAPDGGDTFINDQTPTPGTNNVCFTRGTRMATPDGLRLIEQLRPGDLLLTRDHGVQPIRWIWARFRTLDEVAAEPALRAVRIRKGALGAGLPKRVLYVSRQHRLLVRSRVARRVFGCDEVLVAAKDLTGLPGIDLAEPTHGITYFHLLLEDHEILFAEGAPAESLYLGGEALGALEPAARAELCAIYGRDWQSFLSELPEPVRPLAKGRKLHRLTARHRRNARPLLEPLGARSGDEAQTCSL